APVGCGGAVPLPFVTAQAEGDHLEMPGEASNQRPQQLPAARQAWDHDERVASTEPYNFDWFVAHAMGLHPPAFDPFGMDRPRMTPFRRKLHGVPSKKPISFENGSMQIESASAEGHRRWSTSSTSLGAPARKKPSAWRH